MTLTIGCDPETKRPAFATYDGEQCIDVCQISTAERFRYIKDFFANPVFDSFDRKVFAIEGTYESRGKKHNFKGMKALREVIDRIKFIAEDAGFEVMPEVPNQTWTCRVLHCHPHSERAERKAVSLKLAQKMFGKSIDNDNKADSFHIGGYQARRN